LGWISVRIIPLFTSRSLSESNIWLSSVLWCTIRYGNQMRAWVDIGYSTADSNWICFVTVTCCNSKMLLIVQLTLEGKVGSGCNNNCFARKVPVVWRYEEWYVVHRFSTLEANCETVHVKFKASLAERPFPIASTDPSIMWRAPARLESTNCTQLA